MSLKDKLEIGLKPDAPFRKDNLPDFQKDDPACDAAATPSDTPPVERARKDCGSARRFAPSGGVALLIRSPAFTRDTTARTPWRGT